MNKKKTQKVTCTFYSKNNSCFIGSSASKESISNTKRARDDELSQECMDSLALFLHGHFAISESQYFLQY